jgi:long-chain acyl-CoA synthetase
MSVVLQAIAQRAVENPQIIALSDELCQFTHSSLYRQVEATAALLRIRCAGERPVALTADNSAAWVILDLACILLGRPLVPLPGFLSKDQRNHAIIQSGAEWLIAEGAISNERPIEVAGRIFSLTKLGTKRVSMPQGTAKITFTSGTTGQPKGVCLSQAAMEAVSISIVGAVGTARAGVHLPILSLSVLLENVAGLYATLLAGGHYRALSQYTIGFGRPFEPDFVRLVDQLRQNRASTAIMVPDIARGTIATLMRKDVKISDLKFLAVGGAKVSNDVLNEARQLGLPLYEGYGLSEAASVVTLNTIDGNRPGSVGRLLPHGEMQLASDGEIIIANPGYLGYVGGPPAPSVYHTGDVGVVDADGYLYIHGRKSNVLITAFGRNILPEWIESELAAEPEIHQAMAFGESESELAALIVPSSEMATDGQLTMAIDAANQKLPDYAKVRRWMRVKPFTPQNQQLTNNQRLRRVTIYDAHGEYMNKLLRRSAQHATFFDRLVKETEQQRAYLLASEQLCRGLAGAISVDTYIQYLGEAYHHVRHTVPLMQLAMSRLPAGREWLARPLQHYIAEEAGHEEWILDDIRNAGGDAEAVRHGKPRLATEFMVAYAYDFISRLNAVGFFGMVFVLESTSTKLATAGADALRKVLGLSDNCFRYLTSHGSLDIEHMQFFETILAHIDHEEDKDAIVHVAQRMYILFANLFRSIPLERTDRYDLF